MYQLRNLKTAFFVAVVIIIFALLGQTIAQAGPAVPKQVCGQIRSYSIKILPKKRQVMFTVFLWRQSQSKAPGSKVHTFDVLCGNVIWHLPFTTSQAQKMYKRLNFSKGFVNYDPKQKLLSLTAKVNMVSSGHRARFSISGLPSDTIAAIKKHAAYVKRHGAGAKLDGRFGSGEFDVYKKSAKWISWHNNGRRRGKK